MPNPNTPPDLTGGSGVNLLPNNPLPNASSGGLNPIVGYSAVSQPTATQPTASSPGDNIGNIVVTAQKRAVPPPTSPSNTANQPTTAQLQQQTMNILQTLGGLQNPLNSYYQVQPVFKLFMTQDVDPFGAVSGANSSATAATAPQIYSAIQNMKNVVLAQTGVTGYNIRSVEMDAKVAGPSQFSIMTNTNEITIVISEAMSVGFPESMVDAAIYLGVKNYLKSFIYLQLQFIAYDQGGNIILDPVSPGLSIPNLWIWQLAIVDIDVHLDAGGGTYTIKCLNQNEICYDPTLFNVPETNTVSGGTLGAITKNLADVLNKSWQSRYGNTVTQYDFQWHKLSETLQGNFVAPDDPAAYPTNFTSPDFSSVDGLEYNGTNTSFVFHNSIDIASFLNSVIKNTQYCQFLAKDCSVAGATLLDKSGFRKGVHWMIEPDIKYTGRYETFTQQYYKVITFHIRPYYTQAGIIDNQQSAAANQPGVSLQALQDHVKQSLLKKRYDYVYTGLNIDVIDFDIHYNYNWQAIVSRFAGKLVNAAQIAPAARVQSSTLTNPSGPAGPQAQQQTASNQVSTQQLYSNFTDAQYAAEQANQKLTDLQKQNGSAADIATAQTNLTQAQTNLSSANAAYSQRIQQQSTTIQVQSNGGSTVYAESLIGSPSSTTSSSPSSQAPLPSTMMIPIAQADKSVDDMGGDGAVQSSYIDKSIFNAVTGQFTAPLAFQFVQISLTIRGDPFWLGQTNIIRMANMRNNTPLPQNTPNYLAGTNCFLLHFRAPVSIGNFAPVFSDSVVFNGLYRAIRVKSIFGGNDGFKQEITGLRLPLIDIAKAANGQGVSPNNAADANNNPAPGATGATANPAPSTAGQSPDWYNSPQAAPYKATIDSAAAQYNVPPQLLAWQIGQESSFDPDAVGAGSTSSGVPTGIAQFTTETAKSVPGYGALDPTDPTASINAAAAYDQVLYQQNGNNWQAALTQYGTLSGNPSQATWNGFNNAMAQSGLRPGS